SLIGRATMIQTSGPNDLSLQIGFRRTTFNGMATPRNTHATSCLLFTIVAARPPRLTPFEVQALFSRSPILGHSTNSLVRNSRTELIPNACLWRFLLDPSCASEAAAALCAAEFTPATCRGQWSATCQCA